MTNDEQMPERIWGMECPRCASVGGFGCYECTPPQPRETVAEAMECLLALVGTPIGRRKLGIEPDDERLVTVRSALRALKGGA